MTSPGTVHLVVPDGIDDPLRPSGGNTYDRRLRQELAARGWSVTTVPVRGSWPLSGESGRRALADAIGSVPDGGVALVDGLVASTLPEVLVSAARRVRLVVLVHMPIGHGSEDSGVLAREREVLTASAAVVTTSAWTKAWLLRAYGLDPTRVHVAPPGVDAACPAAATPGGGSLLCVGAVSPGKGHDLLVAALCRIDDLAWRCVCAGPLTVAPAFVTDLRWQVRAAGLEGRVVLTGPLAGPELEAAYDAADLLVLPSRAETYGMVVTEALARAIPVVATDVGGVHEALGMTVGGPGAGILTPPGDATALARALRQWLTDDALRRRLREAAMRRRTELAGWPETADRVGRVLAEVA